MSTATAHKTAIPRWSLSRPVASALEDGLLSIKTTFFDYRCGCGGDLKRLHRMGVPVSGWDPAFFHDENRTLADVVNHGYVVNLIEDPEERAVALRAAWELAQRILIVRSLAIPLERFRQERKALTGQVVQVRKSSGDKAAPYELRTWDE